MLVPFKSLPKDSRIWIFPSSEEIDIQKKTKIKERLIKFISDWTSHNKNLQASFELPYNRFIVVALNEENESIDYFLTIGDKSTQLNIPKHSIQTIVFDHLP